MFSELGLGDDDGEAPGGEPEEPPFSWRGKMVREVPAVAVEPCPPDSSQDDTSTAGSRGKYYYLSYFL